MLDTVAPCDGRAVNWETSLKRVAEWETLPFFFRKSVSENVSITCFYRVLLSDTISMKYNQ